MQLGILAARDARAQEQIIETAEALAKRFGLKARIAHVPGRDPLVKAMKQREQVAELLTELVKALEAADKAAAKADRAAKAAGDG